MWQVGIFICIGWIISVCFHEFGHAIVAYWGGDTSVKDKGYLTFNPLKYTDPGLSLLLPVLFLIVGGIGLPGGAVYIDRSRLKNRWWESAVSAAGPLANLLVIFLLMIPFVFHWEDWLDNSWLMPSLAFLVILQIFAVIFNLLPIPPLDGYGIIRPWLSPKIQQFLSPLSKYGIWIIIGLLWFSPPINEQLWSLIFTIAHNLGVSIEMVGEGFALFNHPLNKLGLIVVLLGTLWLIKDLKISHKPIQGQPNLEQFHHFSSWYSRAWMFEKSEQYEAALQVYDAQLQARPEDHLAWYYRGQVLEKLQEKEEALISYEKALLVSSELYQNYNFHQVISHSKITFNQIQIELKSSFYQAWYQRGRVLRQLQRYEEAIQSFDRVLELLPDNCNTWFVRGMTLAENKLYEEAVDSYDRAIEIEPDVSSLWLFRGHAFSNLQNYREAINSYHRAIELNPKSVDAWYNQAYCWYRLEHYKDAIEAYEKVIELQPDLADAWYNQACCHALRDETQLALERLEKAIALDSNRLGEYSKIDPDLQSLYQI